MGGVWWETDEECRQLVKCLRRVALIGLIKVDAKSWNIIIEKINLFYLVSKNLTLSYKQKSISIFFISCQCVNEYRTKINELWRCSVHHAVWVCECNLIMLMNFLSTVDRTWMSIWFVEVRQKMVKHRHRGGSRALGKLFQRYLPTKTHRTYACLHCRAQLANHDELISKVK